MKAEVPSLVDKGGVDLHQDLRDAGHDAAVEVEVAGGSVAELERAVIVAVFGILKGEQEVHVEPTGGLEDHVGGPSDGVYVVFHQGASDEVGFGIHEVAVGTVVALADIGE